MKSPVAFASFWPRPARWLLAASVIVAMPALAGCPGNLEGEFPPLPGADASPDSSGSGGATGSGGAVGTGGTMASTGGMVGSGGVAATGGVTGTGGTTTTGTGGKAGATGAGGRSGTGGMAMGTGGRAGGSTGHGGTTGGGGGSGMLANCDAPTMIFKSATVGCIGGACHSAGTGNQKPDLQTADPTVLKAYKTTVLCAGSSLVVPSNPTSSVLYKVVDGMTCGAQMPVGKPALSTAQEACLAGWIANLP